MEAAAFHFPSRNNSTDSIMAFYMRAIAHIAEEHCYSDGRYREYCREEHVQRGSKKHPLRELYIPCHPSSSAGRRRGRNDYDSSSSSDEDSSDLSDLEDVQKLRVKDVYKPLNTNPKTEREKRRLAIDNHNMPINIVNDSEYRHRIFIEEAGDHHEQSKQ